MVMANGWFYEHDATQPLEQGVILEDFEWLDVESISLLTRNDGTSPMMKIAIQDVIILSQSCDLTNNKSGYIHVCPIYTLKDYFIAEKAASKTKRKELFGQLASKRHVTKFLTNICTLHKYKKFYNDYLVVDLSKAIVVSTKYVENIVGQSKTGKLLALNAPYRESLAQSYGYFFSRVGNPIDLEPFNDGQYT